MFCINSTTCFCAKYQEEIQFMHRICSLCKKKKILIFFGKLMIIQIAGG